MGRKKQKITTHKKTKTPTKAYELHTDAVEKLATADEGKEKYSKEELKKYKKGGLDAIPVWFKANFIKFWFYGAICYFIFMGLGYYIGSPLDKLVVLAIATGILNDLIVTNIMRFFDEDGNYVNWMFFTKKSYATLIFNILYGFILIFIVNIIYFGINKLINNSLAVEPLLYGLLCLFVDIAFIGMKRLIIKIIKDANKKLDDEKNEDKK